MNMTKHILNPYPLEDIARTWQDFIDQASIAETFRVGSTVLKALASEANARVIYAEAWRDYEQDRNGTLLCYALCEVLNEFTEASQAWVRVATYLDGQLKQEAEEYLQELHAASVHDFQRVSFLHLTVQTELQQVAKTQNILLSIGVLENQEEGQSNA